MRGQIYDIGGWTYFVFGGGNSIDKGSRTPGISWWPEEMPSTEEYEEGQQNLEKHGNKVDYILTHTCPEHVAERMVPNFPSKGFHAQTSSREELTSMGLTNSAPCRALKRR